MSRRSGQVFKRKDGTWWARTSYLDSVGNRRQRTRRAKNKADAQRLVNQLIEELNGGNPDELHHRRDRMNFHQLANYYSNRYLVEAEFVDGKKVSGLRSLYTV